MDDAQTYFINHGTCYDAMVPKPRWLNHSFLGHLLWKHQGLCYPPPKAFLSATIGQKTKELLEFLFLFPFWFISSFKWKKIGLSWESNLWPSDSLPITQSIVLFGLDEHSAKHVSCKWFERIHSKKLKSSCRPRTSIGQLACWFLSAASGQRPRNCLSCCCCCCCCVLFHFLVNSS